MQARQLLSLMLTMFLFLSQSIRISAVSGQQASDRKPTGMNRNGQGAETIRFRAVFKSLGVEQVTPFLSNRNPDIQAMALTELKERNDTSQVAWARKRFDELHFKPSELRAGRDRPLPPEQVLFIAAAEYLAHARGGEFTSVLLAREEVWAVPPYFVSAVAELGEGWIRAAIPLAREDTKNSALSYLVSAAATAESAAELRDILRSDRSRVWEGAVEATLRLRDESCWQALEASAPERDAADQLLVGMVQFRARRVDESNLFGIAREIAQNATATNSPQEWERLVWRLTEFLQLARAMNLKLPESLADALTATGSTSIQGQVLMLRDGTGTWAR